MKRLSAHAVVGIGGHPAGGNDTPHKGRQKKNAPPEHRARAQPGQLPLGTLAGFRFQSKKSKEKVSGAFFRC